MDKVKKIGQSMPCKNLQCQADYISFQISSCESPLLIATIVPVNSSNYGRGQLLLLQGQQRPVADVLSVVPHHFVEFVLQRRDPCFAMQT